MDDTEEILAVAAVVHVGGGEADGPLLEFIRRMQLAGRVLRGLVPGMTRDANNDAIRAVRDLYDNTVFPIGQSLGKDSKSCSLDPGALVQAGFVLRQAADSGADLVIVNRFGILEADGDGFCAEMLEIISRGYPLLTVVSPPYLDAWREFTGGLAAELPPDPEMMLQWFEGLTIPTSCMPADAGHTPHKP